MYEISGDADLIVVHVDDTVGLREMLDKMWLTAPAEISSTQARVWSWSSIDQSFHFTEHPTFRPGVRNFSSGDIVVQWLLKDRLLLHVRGLLGSRPFSLCKLPPRKTRRRTPGFSLPHKR